MSLGGRHSAHHTLLSPWTVDCPHLSQNTGIYWSTSPHVWCDVHKGITFSSLVLELERSTSSLRGVHQPLSHAQPEAGIVLFPSMAEHRVCGRLAHCDQNCFQITSNWKMAFLSSNYSTWSYTLQLVQIDYYMVFQIPFIFPFSLEIISSSNKTILLGIIGFWSQEKGHS